MTALEIALLTYVSLILVWIVAAFIVGRVTRPEPPKPPSRKDARK